MKKIRIGNDIPIKWTINRDGQPEDFSGKTIKLLMRSMSEEGEITDYKVDGNVISWTFFGKDQTKATAYTFTLIENEGQEGMFTIDACRVLQLVECSDQADNDDSDINVEETTDGTIGEVTADSEIQIPAASTSTDIDLDEINKKLNSKQDILEAGLNIQTINHDSILTFGNLSISGKVWKWSDFTGSDAQMRTLFLERSNTGDIIQGIDDLDGKDAIILSKSSQGGATSTNCYLFSMGSDGNKPTIHQMMCSISAFTIQSVSYNLIGNSKLTSNQFSAANAQAVYNEIQAIKHYEWDFATMKESAVGRSAFLYNAKLGDIVKNVEVTWSDGTGGSFKQLTTDIVLISKNPYNTTKSANWNSILYDASQYIQPISIVLSVSNESIAAAGVVLQRGSEVVESDTVVIDGEGLLWTESGDNDWALSYENAKKILEAIKGNKRIVINKEDSYGGRSATVIATHILDDSQYFFAYFVENRFIYMSVQFMGDGTQVSLSQRDYVLPWLG